MEPSPLVVPRNLPREVEEHIVSFLPPEARMVLLGIKDKRQLAITAPVAAVRAEASEELCRYLEGLAELGGGPVEVHRMALCLPESCSLYTAGLPARMLAAAASSALLELTMDCSALVQQNARDTWGGVLRHLAHALSRVTALQRLKLVLPLASHLTVRLDRMLSLRSLDFRVYNAGSGPGVPTIFLGACQLTALRLANTGAKVRLSHPQTALQSLVLAGSRHPTFDGVEHLAALTVLLLEPTGMSSYSGLTKDANGCISLPSLALVRGTLWGVRVDPRVKADFQRRGVAV